MNTVKLIVQMLLPSSPANHFFLGGSEGRNRATALGAVITIEEATKRRNIDIKGSRVAIQGFGNAGSFIAKILHDMEKNCSYF